MSYTLDEKLAKLPSDRDRADYALNLAAEIYAHDSYDSTADHAAMIAAIAAIGQGYATLALRDEQEQTSTVVDAVGVTLTDGLDSVAQAIDELTSITAWPPTSIRARLMAIAHRMVRR